MGDTVIKVENLSKQFKINAEASNDTLRGQLTGAVRGLLHRNGQMSSDANRIWALKDISFEVERGQALGIVGPNGSGKSTLLKILSRILRPTHGRIEIEGRIGSLLEVGTGFHPEFTGRENIYMNAAILGMSRQEIRRKFDEIVAFAEVERFIDTPTKHYSSGMYMRLAFSVAAHLEQEILIIDEVLAVGDTNFQRRSLAKMSEVTQQGRTVLFVTHNMASLAGLCQRSILLTNGEKIIESDTSDVIKAYLGTTSQEYGERRWHSPEDAPGNDVIRLKSVRVISNGKVTTDVDMNSDIHIEFEYWNLKPEQRINVGFGLFNVLGIQVFTAANWASANLIVDEWGQKSYPVGVFRSVCTIPGHLLNDGQYRLDLTITTDIHYKHVIEQGVITFMVHETGEMSREFIGKWRGVIRPKLAWKTARVGSFEALEESL